MKCLVTGGAGFIGSHVVDLLIEEGHEVTVLDNLTTGKRENVNKKADFYPIDVSCCFEDLKAFFKDKDWVFHLAAWPRIPRSIKDPIGTNKANVVSTLHVLQASKEQKVKRIIYSSSSSVYGDQDTYLMNEDMTLRPKSPYALQKLISEQYCQMFVNLFKMEIISLRYFNVYGPRQPTAGAYTLVIGKFLDQVKRRKSMTIYGDGEQTRAYTYVSDVARANLLAAKAEFPLEIGGGFYFGHYIVNIGTNKETSVNEIAKLIGGESKYIVPNPREKFEIRRQAADYGRAKQLIGWEPTIDIVKGIGMLKNE